MVTAPIIWSPAVSHALPWPILCFRHTEPPAIPQMGHPLMIALSLCICCSNCKPSSCSAWIAPTYSLKLCSIVTSFWKPSLITLNTFLPPLGWVRVFLGSHSPGAFLCYTLSLTLCLSLPTDDEHCRAGIVSNCSHDFIVTLLCARPRLGIGDRGMSYFH